MVDRSEILLFVGIGAQAIVQVICFWNWHPAGYASNIFFEIGVPVKLFVGIDVWPFIQVIFLLGNWRLVEYADVLFLELVPGQLYR